ncbi:FkbM family methyltransferase [Helicobacter equorum]|uniref:FkbM family methyltransferase n=1 Tax=Helicobacter equorum TaxID=361872 RepID=UPI000CF0D402|nr:FkbM family methyltransferase [Helicobacter equorum]
MKGLAKSLLSFLLPKALYDTLISFKNLYITRFATKCYSQEGEDLLLSRIFGDQKDGFYVDVGAHHPFRFSNTYLLYKRGWRGINIDAMPGSMKLFNRFRPRDINIECGVASGGGELIYHIFNEPALNGFSEELSASYEKNPLYFIKARVPICVRKLSEILDLHLPSNTRIDILSIDCEALDLEVLQSNNWQKYVPRIILVEVYCGDISQFLNHPIYVFLVSRNYSFYAKLHNTVLFRYKS